MKRDPLIDEVRAARHAISARFGHDPEALVEHYRQFQKKYARRLLREEPELVAARSNKGDRKV
jgi:hypothetical protein